MECTSAHCPVLLENCVILGLCPLTDPAHLSPRPSPHQSGDHSGGTNEQPVRLRGESPPSGHMTDRDQGRRMFTEKGGGGGGGDDEASTANSLSQTDLPLATRGEVSSTEFSKPNEEGKAMPPPPHPPQRTRPQPHPSEEAPSPPTSKAQLMPPPSLPGASLRSKGTHFLWFW